LLEGEVMTNYEAIKLLIEEEVRVDIFSEIYNHEKVAEHLAERFAALEEKIARLEDKLAKCEEQQMVK
jgi:uncharacterized small protein (DUF1192 family)